MPDDIPALLEIADDQIDRPTSKKELIRAVDALEKVRELLGERSVDVEPVEVHIRLALACFLVSEREDETAKKLAWITKGEEAAEETLRERPNRVEGYYYLAVLQGRRLEHGGLSGIIRVRSVEDLGLKAVDIDPSFEEGGPYRLLAMLYAKAPPWPTSVGDVDLALEYAEKAVELSDYALNHLIMAEVLIEAEEFDEAKAELRKVLSAPKTGRWARDGEQWRPHARQLLRQLESLSSN
ncbi:MAG: hypothetical protein GY854_00840 [Deltaproteobacteria bacterium]|nr:hypothetical protein [Deltaproteobacteria bacterium]